MNLWKESLELNRMINPQNRISTYRRGYISYKDREENENQKVMLTLEEEQMNMAYKYHYEELFGFPEPQDCPP